MHTSCKITDLDQNISRDHGISQQILRLFDRDLTYDYAAAASFQYESKVILYLRCCFVLEVGNVRYYAKYLTL